jgi:predicted anti-sigma-YlaC factor YlaD
MSGRPELTCKDVVELVTEYLEGAMPPDDRDRFEEHLSICEGCTNYLAQMRTTLLATGMLTEEQIPPDQRKRLTAAFRDWKRR